MKKKTVDKVNKGEELMMAISAISAEKNIPKEALIETLEAALLSAYKKNFDAASNAEVSIDRTTGDFKVYSVKTVVDEITENENTQITLEKAKKEHGLCEVGDIVKSEVTPADFGRIAAQTAKNVVTQRIREAERNNILTEYADKENNIITGIVRRIEKGKVFLEIGSTEALLPPAEQIPGETYNFHDKLRVYVTKVESGAKGVSIIVSRAHSGLVKRLFESEIPEIEQGIVQIKGICREAGSRTKIAVYSADESVDAQGACIGAQGRRVALISEAIGDEKIDIIKWSEDPAEYIAASLSPSSVTSVTIDEEAKSAFVIVPDNQLSLAIGKSGQNARLAAKLTGWKIDIKSESVQE